MNLQAQISARQELARQGRLLLADRAGLVELLTLRGQALGRIADYERAADTAVHLVSDEPDQGIAFLARGRTHATFHRFTQALTDLTTAEQLGVEPTEADAERAAIHQALGRYNQAQQILDDAARRRADFETLGALAGLYAQRADIHSAERLFDDSRARYRGVSPFPLALLDFHRGRMWLTQGDLSRALLWFDAALRRLPDFAPAQGHYAQVQAALGQTASAIARLRQLSASSDDPDYPARLAIILNETGQSDEAGCWREQATARYEQLCARHPDAFADHSATFQLAIGGEPNHAQMLARPTTGTAYEPRE
ncbi:tetratricopeptide repeat protein [Streptomyces sp. NPDC028722]|uniref:tetratricopeptide repeat protein n=1 Tax=Streptomyces sp. NPDC028722 TaxID=3155016 RepID=UPI0033C1D1D8